MKISRRKALVGGLASLIALPFIKPSAVVAAAKPACWASDAELIVGVPVDADYRSVALDGPPMIDGWGYEPLTAQGLFQAKPDVVELLRRMGSPEWSVAEAAMGDFTGAVFIALHDEILSRTNLEYHRRQLGECFPNHTSQDIGSSIDWKLRYCRDARWDIAGRAIELYANSIVKKINEVEVPGAFITDHQFWPDPSMRKQERVGFFGWVELEIPDAS